MHSILRFFLLIYRSARFTALILLVPVLVLALLTGRTSAETRPTIYFYNPETNINRNVVLKHTLDSYLEADGDFQFQPVDDQQVFEQLVSRIPDAIFMMSSWHLQQLSSQTEITPVLRGVRNGKDTYRKLLVRQIDTAQVPDLSRMTIATSGNEDYSRSILRQMFPDQPESLLADTKILVVPKDIDALMAIGFGMADAALATELSLEKLSTLYKNQHQRLQIIAQSQPLKRLVVAVPVVKTTSQSRLLQLLQQMHQSEGGRVGLSMLGLDGWQQVELNEPLSGEAK